MKPDELTPEEQANQRRAGRHEQSDDKGIIETLNRPFESFVNPLVEREPDEDELAEQRLRNDEESRES